eukprot:7075166-Prymnesium_polylepis.1
MAFIDTSTHTHEKQPPRRLLRSLDRVQVCDDVRPVLLLLEARKRHRRTLDHLNAREQRCVTPVFGRIPRPACAIRSTPGVRRTAFGLVSHMNMVSLSHTTSAFFSFSVNLKPLLDCHARAGDVSYAAQRRGSTLRDRSDCIMQGA